MDSAWVGAFAIAVTLALTGTPWLSRRAAKHGRSSRRVAFATAAVPPVAVFSGSLAVVDHFDTALAVGCVAAAWLWWAGALVEQGRLPGRLAPAARLAVAGIVVAGGLRLELTGVEAADSVVTVAVVWLVVSAWRSAETRDHLLLGWAAVIAAGAALVGGLDGQGAVAGVGAAIGGACLGCFPYTVAPVAARLRASGAQFLGCMVVVVALDARSDVRPPGAAVVALLLLALPAIEGIMVGAARIRDRRADPMRIGLTGRWRALGTPRPLLAVVLIGAQCALALLALFVARTLVSPQLGAVVGMGVVVAVWVPALAARRESTRGRWPVVAFVVAGGIVVGAAVVTVPAAVALWRARETAVAAAAAIRRGVDATRSGDTVSAAAAFDEAARGFDDARRRLADPLVSWGVGVPVVGPNLRAARELTAIGADLARTGRRLTTTADVQRLHIVNATVDVAELRRLAPELAATTVALEDAQDRVRAIDRDFLVPQVDDAIGKLADTIRLGVHEGHTATVAAEVLPAVLGADVSQRYVLALQNPAEARATGGIFGNWGEITVENGKLDLVELGKSDAINPRHGEPRILHAPADYTARYARFAPERYWQDVNLSPDLPTSARVAVDEWAQAGRAPVEGVIVVDPVGLAAVLRLTGPITVAPWPTPIDAGNVVDVTLHQAYVRFADDNQQRDDFLGDVARATWRALSSRDLGSPAHVLHELGGAARGKHVMLWFARADAERLARRAGVAGDVVAAPSDSLLVTTQNSAANKLDIYLQRRVGYRLDLQPLAGGAFDVRGTIAVGLHNRAPSTGLPQYVLGPNSPGLTAGDNRTFLSVYTPLGLDRAAADGVPATMESGRELGRSVYSSIPVLASGTSRTLRLTVGGRVGSVGRRRYELTVLHQPGVDPVPTRVDLRLPEGWRFADPRGLRLCDDGRRAVFEAAVDRDLTLSVLVVHDRAGGLWGRLQDGG